MRVALMPSFLLLPLFFLLASEQKKSSAVAEQQCRTRGVFLEPKEFTAETCATCYIYVHNDKFKSPIHKWYFATRNVTQVPLQATKLTNGTHEITADASDAESPLLETFVDAYSAKLWKDCCEAAHQCCQLMISNHNALKSDERCPATWDGWQCWPDGGQPDHVEYRSCPSYISFFSDGRRDACGSYAEKTCESAGQWKLNDRGLEWTNFKTCAVVNKHLTQEKVHMVLYIISVVALMPAIIIFFAYKVLRVPRIAIHKNLFASLLLHCVSMITFKAAIFLPYIQGDQPSKSTLAQNTHGCQFLMMLTKYFRLTNYTWMFCEGYYLHRLLANTFEEERSITFILSIGWGIPLIPCLIYAILRIFYDNSMCWAEPSSDAYVEWIYMSLGLACIVANSFFFFNIFRILVTKLQAPHANEPAHFRKAVKATVILLPLFGLHWLLTLYRPSSGNCILLSIYKYLNITLDGLQGLMVAIAFCYRNAEIIALLRRSLANSRQTAEGTGGAAGVCTIAQRDNVNFIPLLAAEEQGVIQAGCGGGAGPLLLTANSSLRPQILMSPGLTTPSPSYSNGNQKDNSLLECYQAKSNHESTSNYSMKQLLNAE